jgi:uncharacterized protein
MLFPAPVCMNRPRIRTFSVHCREQYGQALGKIPLDLGLPCPNRARGGCLYCRPASFTPFSLRATDTLAEQIRRGKEHLLKGRFNNYLAYFQQETTTALATVQLIPLLAQVLADPDCRGLILSTRPDHIAADLPAALGQLIRSSGKTCLIELGLQSTHDRSLRLLNRNHSFTDCVDAVRRLHAEDGLEIGVHLILGIPGESEAEMLTTVQTVCKLPIQALKLHHLQVIESTPLALLHDQSPVPLFTQEAYLELLLLLLPHIPPRITVHRLWSTAHPQLLIAPKWGCLSADLSRKLHEMMKERGLRQGQRSEGKTELPQEGVQQQ